MDSQRTTGGLDWPSAFGEQISRIGDLLGEELQDAATQWRRRIAWQLAALCSLLIALGLAGVSALLSVASPAPDGSAVWVLWVVPAVPAVLAAFCALAAGPAPKAPRLWSLRARVGQAGATTAPATAAPRPSVAEQAADLALQTGREALAPLAREHPLALVGAAAAAGAAIAWAQPWRQGKSPEWALVVSRLGSDFLERHAASWIEQALAAVSTVPRRDESSSYTSAMPAPTPSRPAEI